MICMQKMNVIAKISCYLRQCRYTKTAQRIFKYSDIQYTSLTLDKILNSLVYGTLFYFNIYWSNLQTSKTVCFWPTLYILLAVTTVHFCFLFDCFWLCTSAIDCLERLVSEMSYAVSSGTLNSTHSLTLAYSLFLQC